jgi:hypothetical protein
VFIVVRLALISYFIRILTLIFTFFRRFNVPQLPFSIRLLALDTSEQTGNELVTHLLLGRVLMNHIEANRLFIKRFLGAILICYKFVLTANRVFVLHHLCLIFDGSNSMICRPN